MTTTVKVVPEMIVVVGTIIAANVVRAVLTTIGNQSQSRIMIKSSSVTRNIVTVEVIAKKVTKTANKITKEKEVRSVNISLRTNTTMTVAMTTDKNMKERRPTNRKTKAVEKVETNNKEIDRVVASIHRRNKLSSPSTPRTKSIKKRWRLQQRNSR